MDKKQTRPEIRMPNIKAPLALAPTLESLTSSPRQASMTPREPSPRELLADKLERQLSRVMPEPSARKAARKLTGHTYGMGLADITPAGLPLWAYEGGQQLAKAYQAAGEGEYGTAALEGLMGALNVAPGVHAAGKIVPEALNVGAAAVGKRLEPFAEKIGQRAMERGGLPAQLLQDIGRGGMSPLTVYHGSPHKFERFDMSKIGTGEGAQAYGHGLYFAEAPGVAESYKGFLSKKSAMTNPEYVRALKKRDALAEQLSIKYGISDLNTFRDLVESGKTVEIPKKYVNALRQSDEKIAQAYENAVAQTGALYKVDIPDEAVARMLDWDKPLSEQHPDVQKIIGDEIKRIGGSAHTGEQAYKELMFEAKMAGKKSESPVMRNNIEANEASKRLQELGIPGIKYLDENSRAAGEGTRNFVVFDESLPRILEVNEKPTGALPWRKGEWGGKPQYPQEEALETARKNAVTMLGLPEKNTAMDRARAMGFEVPVYHGTKTPERITSLIPGGTNESVRTGDAYGFGVYTTTDPFEASSYAGEGGVLPLLLRRQGYLSVDNPSEQDLARLSEFSGAQMLPSDKARFEIGRKQQKFENLEEARNFFANQRENWKQFGDGYDRARPEAIANPDGTFSVEFTDFDSPVPITSGKDAETLLKAVGWDTVPIIGYPGHTLEKGAGRQWDITTKPQNIRSRFAAFDPARINENDLLGYADLGILPYLAGAGALGGLGLSQIKEPEKKKGAKDGK